VGAGLGTAAAGVAGVVAGVAAVAGESWSVRLPGVLPLAGIRLDVDPLSGLFILVTGAVGVCVAVYGIGYSRPGGGEPGLEGRTVQAVLPLFLGAMLLVPAAGSVSTFLVAWELMALTSLLLVLAEHRERPGVAEAGPGTRS
jgi:hydrogenase-4 component B